MVSAQWFDDNAMCNDGEMIDELSMIRVGMTIAMYMVTQRDGKTVTSTGQRYM